MQLLKIRLSLNLLMVLGLWSTTTSHVAADSDPQEAMASLAKKDSSVKGKVILTVKEVSASDMAQGSSSSSSGGSRQTYVELQVEMSGLKPNYPYEWFIQRNPVPKDDSCTGLGPMVSFQPTTQVDASVVTANGGTNGTVSPTSGEQTRMFVRRDLGIQSNIPEAPADPNNPPPVEEASLVDGDVSSASSSASSSAPTSAASNSNSDSDFGSLVDPANEFTTTTTTAAMFPFQLCQTGDLQNKFGYIRSSSSKFDQKFMDQGLHLSGEYAVVNHAIVVWDKEGNVAACGTITTDMSGRTSAATLSTTWSGTSFVLAVVVALGAHLY
ncbi:hypothetical protein BJ085DRAFT_41194 [Dimargaris cristalligena]|uniref:Uncharacterized protein n=1 Tax=Dimargaris cristalligena TaxID=215637 RepID=A0A4P9ZNK1_9FUNG|nr:hypothetical protein BJ085DRAFT_41194 [Dimargaris cristalligena]|eukprot:RKP34755.1 hypothetical protein BJ085DRAFT_41194 [Dimargaris cristalligena]